MSRLSLRLALKRPILTILFASMTFVLTFMVAILNQGGMHIDLFKSAPDGPLSGLRLTMLVRSEDSIKEGEWSYCTYEAPLEPSYNVELQQVNVDDSVTEGGVFAVDMVFKNTGNSRLFSADSNCEGPVLNLGTQYTQDRNSLFGEKSRRISGWLSESRVQMTDPYVDPEGTFHVIFQSLAPTGNNVYREFFQPVVEGSAWIAEVFPVDITVGTPTQSMQDNMAFVRSLSIDAQSLEGLAKSVSVSLKEQMMYANMGDYKIWSMQISSGAYDTPTPRGTYKILTKQELRIGGTWPHYRMPYFQMWDSRGYGIHALPYLATDGGTFWSEALTHIGTPVSHGCIRTLPEDAAQIYAFTEIGTPVTVY